ncbi:NAD-dependent epimerase/dehydratase family protein [Lentilitoribacter sp. Alg239-R112]|uniref:NAD-dependent epimerase/dehydratase family protein n=1 Tax=Lentilitoribacter sp. Alg239-R112 TaxID=2305987 RepID=UPI0013A692E7|nr:NAD-dependent epimerase/dehydratase family protein [Lentilitoribacter sp. Alg239-R112]
MAKTVLILGASGKIGRHSKAEFEKAGWDVKIFNRRHDNMIEAAEGVDVIINGLNPAGYKNWATQIPKITNQVIAAAKSARATIIVPGNVYVFGKQAGVWDENTPHRADTRKGKIRIEMEEAYKAAASEFGVQTIILRAGDFIDDKRSDTLMGMGILSGLEKGAINALGDPNAKHTYCYLPDWARACVQVSEKRNKLNVFEDIPFPGSIFSIKELAITLSEKLGRQVKVKKFPWALIYLTSPFWKTGYEMIEMRYLNDIDHSLSPQKFRSILPDFKTTGIDEIMFSEARA